MNKKEFKKGEIIIYKTSQGPQLDVKLEKQTVWLTQAQITLLFGSERSVITKHLKNIFKEGEIIEKSNVQKMHIPNSDKPVKFYSLDVIVSVGYRINSKRATQFRIWATKILKEHLIKGYTINKKRLEGVQEKLKELQSVITFLREKSEHKLLEGQESEILDLLSGYSKSLTLLEQYDKNKLKIIAGPKSVFTLDSKKAKRIIEAMKKEFILAKNGSNLFGQEYGDNFEGIIKGLYQAFGGKELYKSIEEKAAHLLYFIIKDHPFVDGNKRIASSLFIYFLNKNNYLYKVTGEKKIDENALVALALLIAISDSNDKDIMIKIITNLIG